MNVLFTWWESGALLTAGFALTAFLFVLAVAVLWPRKDNRSRIVSMLVDDRQRLNPHDVSPQDGMFTQDWRLVKLLVKRFAPSGSFIADQLALQLARAGFRGQSAMYVFFAAKIFSTLSAVGGLAVAIYLGWMPARPETLGQFGAWALPVVVFFVPDLYVKNTADKRRQALIMAVPDTLDLMVICADAGLSLEVALARVAQEMEAGYPELADELGVVAAEVNFLPNREDAFSNLAKRTGLDAFNAIASTLVQCEKYGTPLAQALRLLASEQREMRMLRAEEKAARIPVLMTLPLVVFVLPPLMIVLLGPAIIQALRSF